MIFFFFKQSSCFSADVLSYKVVFSPSAVLYIATSWKDNRPYIPKELQLAQDLVGYEQVLLLTTQSMLMMCCIDRNLCNDSSLQYDVRMYTVSDHTMTVL